MTWSRNFILDWIHARLDGRRTALGACVDRRAAMNFAAWLFSVIGLFIAREAVRLVYGLTWAVSQLVAGIWFLLSYAIDFVLDCVGFVVGLILSIPILGGILRTVLNWGLEVGWRLLGLADFVASLFGLRLKKRFRFGVIIPKVNGIDIATEAQLQPQVDTVITVYKNACNIDAKFTGYSRTEIAPPGGTLVVDCGLGGYFADWWIKGSWFEFVSKLAKFRKNWRNVFGYGGEIIAFPVNNITPDDAAGSTIGCSFAGTHNFVSVEANADHATMAHEFGHAFLLGHDNGSTNLMSANVVNQPAPSITMTNWQISVVRSSRHVTYV
jgi:hypothetical protein